MLKPTRNLRRGSFPNAEKVKSITMGKRKFVAEKKSKVKKESTKKAEIKNKSIDPKTLSKIKKISSEKNKLINKVIREAEIEKRVAELKRITNSAKLISKKRSIRDKLLKGDNINFGIATDAAIKLTAQTSADPNLFIKYLTEITRQASQLEDNWGRFPNVAYRSDYFKKVIPKIINANPTPEDLRTITNFVQKLYDRYYMSLGSDNPFKCGDHFLLNALYEFSSKPVQMKKRLNLSQEIFEECLNQELRVYRSVYDYLGRFFPIIFESIKPMQNLKNMQKVTKMFADMNHKEKVQFFSKIKN